MKIRKAERHEAAQYDQTYHVHPLFGFARVGGVLNGVQAHWTVAIEYLGEGKGEPNYEAIAPKGMHFYDGDALHTYLGTTQKDLTDRLAGFPLEVCKCPGHEHE